MQDPMEQNARRLEKINRYLMISAIVLVISIIILVIVDF
jgi:hypothetical protein